MRQFIIIILIFVTVMFAGLFAAGYYLLQLTPQSIEFAAAANAKRAEISLLEAKTGYIETQVRAKIRLLKLSNLQTVQQSQLYRTALTIGRSTLAIWPLWILIAIVGGIVSQRERLTPKVDFRAGDIQTRIPARAAVALVERAIQVSELEAAERTLAYGEDISRARLADGLSVVKAVKSIATPAPALALPEFAGVSAAPAPLPAMSEILAGLTPGDEIVLGYDMTTGDALTGDLSNLYSAGIFGGSGSGKTAWTRGLISQTILTYPDALCYVLDAHDGHPESLSATLPKCQQIKILDIDAPLTGIREFARLFATRQQAHFSDPSRPLIFLIDELRELSGRKWFGELDESILQIVPTAGRKYQAFLFLVSQDARQSHGLEARDMLRSLYCFQNKRKQLQTLLQDTSDVQKVMSAKEPGVCLFVPTSGESQLVRVPYCLPEDMTAIESRLKPAETPDSQGVTGKTGEVLRAWLAADPEGRSQRKLSKSTGISQSKISDFVNGKNRLNEQEKKAIWKEIEPTETEENAGVINLESYRKKA